MRGFFVYASCGVRRMATIAISLIVSLSGVAIARAHHAWNEIDTSRSITLSGTVTELKWENPHASLVLEATDGASTHWTVMMNGLARMESRGVHGETVAVGKTLTIVASPARDDAHVVRANRIRSDGKDYVLY